MTSILRSSSITNNPSQGDLLPARSPTLANEAPTQAPATQLRETRPGGLRRAWIKRRVIAGRSLLLPRTRPSSPALGSLLWLEARQAISPSSEQETPTTERPEFYTRQAAAKRLGVGKTTVWELTRRGVIGVAYIGSKPLIPAAELERYIASLVEEARERAEACYRPTRRRG